MVEVEYTYLSYPHYATYAQKVCDMMSIVIVIFEILVIFFPSEKNVFHLPPLLIVLLHTVQYIYIFVWGEENGNLQQYSCLKNPMNRGAWQATVHGVEESWTRLTN